MRNAHRIMEEAHQAISAEYRRHLDEKEAWLVEQTSKLVPAFCMDKKFVQKHPKIVLAVFRLLRVQVSNLEFECVELILIRKRGKVVAHRHFHNPIKHAIIEMKSKSGLN